MANLSTNAMQDTFHACLQLRRAILRGWRGGRRRFALLLLWQRDVEDKVAPDQIHGDGRFARGDAIRGAAELALRAERIEMNVAAVVGERAFGGACFGVHGGGLDDRELMRVKDGFKIYVAGTIPFRTENRTVQREMGYMAGGVVEWIQTANAEQDDVR